jgi:hypothetical protein
MAAESRVQQLLDEISAFGRTPEEVCGARPELLPEGRRRWQQMRIVEAELDTLFPLPGPDPVADTAAYPPRHGGADSPRIRAATLVDVDGVFDPAGAEPRYLSAFADAGLGRDGDDSEAVAAGVRASTVRAEIVAALDDWASLTPDLRRREWLLAVARGADPDGIRDRLRQPELWLDAARLTRLARELRAAELSPQSATALGRVSRKSGGEAIALLTATQNRFPQDFWVTFDWVYSPSRSIRYLQ